MNPAVDDRPSEIHQYVALLRSRKWSILAVTAIVVGSALIVSFQQTAIYRSEVSVLVNLASPTAPSGQPPGLVTNLETERKLAVSRPVVERMARELDIQEDPEELLETLSADIEEETEILVLAAEHPQPEEAHRRAVALADAYLGERRSQIIDGLLDASEGVRQRIGELNTRLTALTNKLPETTGRSRRAALTAEINSVIGQIALLEQRLSDLSPAGSLSVGRIVEPATIPETPVRPKHLVNALLALFLGLGFGLGVAVVRERLDVRLRGREDLEARASAPVLGVLPRMSGDSDGNTPTMLADPMSPAAEAYRALRTSLLFAASERGAKTILITSPERGEGKTTTAANLGIALSQAGRQVILVSADLRRPRLHESFGASNRSGLSTVLSAETTPRESIQGTQIDHLKLFPSGPLPGNPTELLGSEAMRTLLGWLREASDFVVIDATPVLPVADTMALAPLADAVLLVTDASRTSRMAVTRARQQLDQVQGRVIGAVLNNFDPRAGSYPYYADPYYSYEQEPAGVLRRFLQRVGGARPEPAPDGAVAARRSGPRIRAPKARTSSPSRTDPLTPMSPDSSGRRPSLKPSERSATRSRPGNPDERSGKDTVPTPPPAPSRHPARAAPAGALRGFSWAGPGPSGRPARESEEPHDPALSKSVEEPPPSAPDARSSPRDLRPPPSRPQPRDDGEPRPDKRIGPPWERRNRPGPAPRTLGSD